MRGLYYGFDTYYMLLVVPAFLISLFAQIRVKSSFKRYEKINNIRGLTGEQVARTILDRNGLYNVKIEPINGSLTDHYDPRTEVIRLSSTVYSSTSIAAIGVAAHETGHAIQHSTGYVPNKLRKALVPVAKIGSSFGPWLAILGLWFNSTPFIQLGLIFFSAAVLFYIVTLPVEFNASRRAVLILDEYNILSVDEIKPVKRVLSAAAMTYVASALVAIANLLRLFLLSRRRN